VPVAALPALVGPHGVAGVTPHADLLVEDARLGFGERGHTSGQAGRELRRSESARVRGSSSTRIHHPPGPPWEHGPLRARGRPPADGREARPDSPVRTGYGDFERTTTTVHLHGGGETGRGEDVTYDAGEHEALAAWDADLDRGFEFAGEWTLAEFSAALDEVELFPEPPERADYGNYRRWAVEAAALDLALRQAGRTLAEALDREYAPMQFVVSTRLGDPPSAERVEAVLDAYPGAEFKLDPNEGWTDDLVAALARTGRVRILDFKAHYEGTEVDGSADADLYRRVAGTFPDAIVEDPAVTDGTREVVSEFVGRLSWDAPVDGVASLRALPFEPAHLNVKPSRFGSVESLFECVEHCRERGIGMYAGGQFELDVGRGQAQALASLFYPDAPNDVAPTAYNDEKLPPDLPTSPLAPPGEPRGFRW